MQSYKFTEEQKKLREHWLKGIIFITIIWPVLYLCVSVITLPSGQVVDRTEFVTLLFGTILGSSLFVLILYLVAYKKPGTRFLTVLIAVILPFSIFKSLIDLIQAFSENTPVLSIAQLLEILLMGWWYKLTLKFRKLNDQIQRDFPIELKP